MIKVNVTSDKNFITNIDINGHSNYEESGKDIVCASVSSIVITTINAIIRLDNKAIDYKNSEGSVSIIVHVHNKFTDVLIDNMIELLEELEKKYKKYIEINK